MWGRAVVARQAHNLKVVGSNPSSATLLNNLNDIFYIHNCIYNILQIIILSNDLNDIFYI